MRTSILTKSQSVRLWQSGAFGNKLRSWNSLEEMCKCGFEGRVAMRSRSGRGGGVCIYDVPSDDVAAILEYQDTERHDLMINEMAPSEATVVQGEYLNDALSWGYFLYSRALVPMREALRTPSTSTGLQTDFILREVMTTASWEDWQELIARYPGHVLEVSIFDHCLGDIPGRNALVWEVRRY